MTENELARAAEGVEVLGELGPGFDRILSPEAIGLVAMLERRFGDERRRLLARRRRKARFSGRNGGREGGRLARRTLAR